MLLYTDRLPILIATKDSLFMGQDTRWSADSLIRPEAAVGILFWLRFFFLLAAIPVFVLSRR